MHAIRSPRFNSVIRRAIADQVCLGDRAFVAPALHLMRPGSSKKQLVHRRMHHGLSLRTRCVDCKYTEAMSAGSEAHGQIQGTVASGRVLFAPTTPQLHARAGEAGPTISVSAAVTYGSCFFRRQISRHQMFRAHLPTVRNILFYRTAMCHITTQ